jgi:hypothetical protein
MDKKISHAIVFHKVDKKWMAVDVVEEFSQYVTEISPDTESDLEYFNIKFEFAKALKIVFYKPLNFNQEDQL